MFKNITITNFKSCHDVHLDDLGHLTVLVGRNGAGKSNILQAISWISEWATSRFSLYPSPPGYYAATVELLCGESLHRFAVTVMAKWRIDDSSSHTPDILVEESLSTHINNAWKRILTRKQSTVKLKDRPNKIKIQATTPSLPALASLLPSDDPVMIQLQPIISFFSSIRYYPMDETTDPGNSLISDSAYKSWLAEFEGTGRARDEVELKLLHMCLTDQGKLDELKSLLGPNGLGVIDDIIYNTLPQPQQSKTAGQNILFYYIGYAPSGASQSVGQRWVFPYAELSHGTRRILRMMVAILFDNSSVMLLEHPEDGIHSGLLRKLMGVIASYTDPAQAIIASHSAEVFNMLKPSDVRLVSMQDGETVVKPLSDTELAVATNFVNNDGPLSDFIETIEDN